MRATLTLLSLGLLCAGTAHAEDHAVALRTGLLGTGVEYTYRFNDVIAVRGALNSSDWSFDGSESGIDYELTLDFDSTTIGVDFHPLQGSFRVSLGLMQNDNGLNAQSQPTDEPIEVGGLFFESDDVGTLFGRIGFDNSTSMYAGVGWEWFRNMKFGFSFDLGLVDQGTPDVRLIATGPIADPNDDTFTPEQKAVFQDRLDAEEAELREDLDDFELYPFANIGFVFRF